MIAIDEEAMAEQAQASRKEKDDYYLDIANEVGSRSTCMIYKVGAIIVQKDEVLSTGYNGAPRGDENCNEVGVCAKSQKQGCRAVPAEVNAIISVARRDMINATIYISGVNTATGAYVDSQPNEMCMKIIKNAGIARIVTRNADGSFEVQDLRKQDIRKFLEG